MPSGLERQTRRNYQIWVTGFVRFDRLAAYIGTLGRFGFSACTAEADVVELRADRKGRALPGLDGERRLPGRSWVQNLLSVAGPRSRFQCATISVRSCKPAQKGCPTSSGVQAPIPPSVILPLIIADNASVPGVRSGSQTTRSEKPLVCLFYS
jgi:hypothetical protein